MSCRANSPGPVTVESYDYDALNELADYDSSDDDEPFEEFPKEESQGKGKGKGKENENVQAEEGGSGEGKNMEMDELEGSDDEPCNPKLVGVGAEEFEPDEVDKINIDADETVRTPI